MDARILNITFWAGILAIASSFMIGSHTLSIMLGGIIIVMASFLLESFDARKHHDVHLGKVINIHRLTLILVMIASLIYFIMIQKKFLLRPDNTSTFYIIFFINFALVVVLLIVCFKTLAKREKIIPISPPENTTPREQLVAFIKQAMARGERREDLKTEALKLGWPKDIVEDELKNMLRGKESPTTIALRDYKFQILKKYIKRALANKHSEMRIKEAGLKSRWPADLIDKAIFESKQELTESSTLELQGDVEDLPQEIFKLKDYETDFDKLYNYIKEKGVVKLVDVAKMFNLTEKQAEEWAQILAKQQLLKLHYPPFGEAELQWINSKVTQ